MLRGSVGRRRVDRVELLLAHRAVPLLLLARRGRSRRAGPRPRLRLRSTTRRSGPRWVAARAAPAGARRRHKLRAPARESTTSSWRADYSSRSSGTLEGVTPAVVREKIGGRYVV